MTLLLGVAILCVASCSALTGEKLTSNNGGRIADMEQQAATVHVSGDVNTDDGVTLSVKTSSGSKMVRLRRVEQSVLHEDVTSFTVLGHHNGPPHMRRDRVSERARRKARQFFYNLDTGAVVSIVKEGASNKAIVEGFVDHETRIRPVPGSGGRVKRDSDDLDDAEDHAVWVQDDSVEWKILSHLGLNARDITHRMTDVEDDDDDNDDDDRSVHRDDYLEVPVIFRDRSLWEKSQRSTNLIDNGDTDDVDYARVSSDQVRHPRRRRRRQSPVDMRHNPFQTTFSSRLSAMRSFSQQHSPTTTRTLPFGPGHGSRSVPFDPRIGIAGRFPVPQSTRPNTFNGPYVLEAMVMVDVSTYSKFNYDPVALEDFILHFWQTVNLRLRAIVDPRLQLQVRSYGKILFSGFQQFIEGNRVKVGGENRVSLSGVIEGFRGWIQSYETNTKYAGHDLAFLMTGENLCKLSSNGSSCPDSPKGIGYMGGACITSRRFPGYTYDVAVAEVDRSYRGVLTATHEIGHLLNVSHDGEGASTACGVSSGYIMSYTWKDAAKFNQFSPCSKLSIANFLKGTWYAECLRDHSDEVYAYRGQLPGRTMSLHDQCQYYNAGIPCSSKSLVSQCHNLCCENILKVSISSEPAADGTKCGRDKSCFAGQCVPDRDLPFP